MASKHSEPPRFVVGIDLGTTNSAVCCIDTMSENSRVEVFPIVQLVAPGQIEERDTLPSFHYQAAVEEFGSVDLDLPWTDKSAFCVGVFARDHGLRVPGRMIASAKSWLCHTGVDRTAKILPWQGQDDVARLSPVDVSSQYLAHIVQCWDAQYPRHPLAEQTVVLTIPASFEEVARNLTIRAAQSAGLPRVQLIEEPQAAFYAWMDQHEHDWKDIVAPGHKILVCDVGGGTSDFTLIRVRAEAEGDVSFHRVAVGEHLILGGDNLDLALAHLIEAKLGQNGYEQLTGRQWSVLVRVARQVKETLLGSDAPEEYTVSIPGTGRRLVGGSIQCSVTREEVKAALVDGFLPATEFGESPQQASSGFREFGLPYADDTAITRYLSRFLQTHASSAADNTLLNDDANPARPDIILFNGGLFESPLLKNQMMACIQSWFDDGAGWSPVILDSERLDLAVAHGAACFGQVTQGRGKRIRAGLPRSYYIGAHTEAGMKAVCLVPAGTEPGDQLDPPPQRFELTTGTPVEFPVFYSGTRLTDPVGSEVIIDPGQLTALPPIRTVIRDRSGDREQLQVSVNCRLTEIGTLDLWCASVDKQQWKLQFDIRSAVQTDREASESGAAEAEGIVDQTLLQTAQEFLSGVFGPDGQMKPGGLARKLAKKLSMSRPEWPTSLLRGIWQILVDLSEGRRKSSSHEANWLNLLGYSLRPGAGFPLDDWRVDRTWDLLRGQLHHTTPECRSQMWILWRRIAGGLNAGQHTAIASPVLSSVRQTVQQAKSGRGKGGAIALHDEDASEIWRALGAFEQLPPSVRTETGEMILDLVSRGRMKSVRDPMIWTLGRLGARVPMGAAAAVPVAASTAEKWLKELLQRQIDDVISTPLTVMQLTRRTGDRFTDVGQEFRDEAIRYLREMNGDARLISLIRDGGATDSETQSAVFGESLPVGLKMRS
jgi:molecular chaperone DnaK (HSP70)